ncbi:MAG: cyclase family protein [Beijerinckiaceae bacterium]|nr:cyclase family protein [Beijerinckiaceae bacterium]
MEVGAGDVLLVRTGYDALWHDEPAYLAAAGVAKSGSLWAAERGAVPAQASPQAQARGWARAPAPA